MPVQGPAAGLRWTLGGGKAVRFPCLSLWAEEHRDPHSSQEQAVFLKPEWAFGRSALGLVDTPRIRAGVVIKDTQPRLDYEISILETWLQAASLS